MVFINFTFDFSKTELQRDNINIGSMFVWLQGHVMFWQGESVWILENVLVIGLFFEMLEKIEILEKGEIDAISVSDYDTYYFYLRKRADSLIIEPDWGYYLKKIEISVSLQEISNLKSEIEKILRAAYSINCILLPETKNIILSDKEKKY